MESVEDFMSRMLSPDNGPCLVIHIKRRRFRAGTMNMWRDMG